MGSDYYGPNFLGRRSSSPIYVTTPAGVVIPVAVQGGQVLLSTIDVTQSPKTYNFGSSLGNYNSVGFYVSPATASCTLSVVVVTHGGNIPVFSKTYPFVGGFDWIPIASIIDYTGPPGPTIAPRLIITMTGDALVYMLGSSHFIDTRRWGIPDLVIPFGLNVGAGATQVLVAAAATKTLRLWRMGVGNPVAGTAGSTIGIQDSAGTNRAQLPTDLVAFTPVEFGGYQLPVGLGLQIKNYGAVALNLNGYVAYDSL